MGSETKYQPLIPEYLQTVAVNEYFILPIKRCGDFGFQIPDFGIRNQEFNSKVTRRPHIHSTIYPFYIELML
jgi:hypothetical protein